jgi:calcineurin-like phosphoesterase family protein
MNHDKLRHMLSRLHGKKHIVWGNHDRGVQQTILSAGFHDLGLLYELNVPPESNNGERQKIILCHYSMRVWNESHYGSLQFYGHSHGSMKVSCNQLDVGVDNAFKLLGEFRPFSLDEAVTFARSYPVTLDQVDHHSK